MPFDWTKIGIKKSAPRADGSGAGQGVTETSKNSTIDQAVSTWQAMGLSAAQIAYGIATIGVESGFNPNAQATTTTAYGLGQFTNSTWVDAVNYYNQTFGGTLDATASRTDPAAQIAVAGAWAHKVWTRATELANDPRFSNYGIHELAYALHHEGAYRSAAGIQRFLQSPSSDFNRRSSSSPGVVDSISGYLNSAYGQAQQQVDPLKAFERPEFNRELFRYPQQWKDFYHSAESTSPPPPPCPIILDLDGDGVETTGVTAGAYFDYDGNGFAEQTGWAGADDGMLVWDRNADGRINNGKELFGNETLLANGSKAANGFAALTELDANLDGKVDASDAAWANLKVWVDADGDGFSSAAELRSLTDVGVQSLNTGYSTSTFVDANSNEHRQIGSFTKTDVSVFAD